MAFPAELLLILTVVLLALTVVLVLVVLRRSRPQRQDGLQLLQQQVASSLAQQDNRLGQLNQQLTRAIQNLTTNLNERLAQGQNLAQQAQKLIAERLEASGKIIGDLRGQLGQLGQATGTIMQVGSEVRKLQDILQSPKLRGGLGEWSLENLLAEVLPSQHYQLQHRFKNGAVVDALVRLAQGSVCIDAKFPLANFRAMLDADDEVGRLRCRRALLKDVCKHIDEIAEKYILPAEGTLEFALMYIPAENVYYETIMGSADNEPDISAYGRGHKVIPVSPNTLYAYLMAIATGLKGLQIERHAQLIRDQLSQFAHEMAMFINDFATLGKHVNNAKIKYDEAGSKLEHFNFRLQQMETQTGEGAGSSAAASNS